MANHNSHAETTPARDDVRQNLPAAVKLLDWDSSHFGIPVGRVDVDSEANGTAEVSGLLDKAAIAGLRLVYVFLPDGEPLPEEILTRFGGLQVDSRATFVLSLGTRPEVDTRKLGPVDNVQVMPLSATSATGELRALAVLAGKYSRFNVDAHIPRERFVSLYHQWVERSVRKEVADDVLVATDAAGSVIGFVTLRQLGNAGEIGLIAVAEHAQGKGVGMRLIEAAQRWMQSRDLTSSSVVTQLRNEPACQLYRKAGYELASVQSVYHFWMNGHDR